MGGRGRWALTTCHTHARLAFDKWHHVAPPRAQDALAASSPRAASSLQPGDTKEALLRHRTALTVQLAEHNTQITELQCAWERARQEEEGKVGTERGRSRAERECGRAQRCG